MPETLDLTVGLPKGGTAKSTTAVLLALAIHQKTGKRVALIDTDKTSQSAMDWSNMAGEAWPHGITVFAWWDSTMRRRVDGIKGDYPVIIRDTGGTASDAADVLRQSLCDTDLLVSPFAPTPAEYRRLPATIGLAQEVGQTVNPDLTFLPVLVKATTRNPDVRDIRDQMDAAGLAYADTLIPNSPAYARMFGTVPRSLLAYDALADEILDGDQ